MIFMLNVHPSRAADLLAPDRLGIAPAHSIAPYLDGFGNKCVRLLARPGTSFHVITHEMQAMTAAMESRVA
jgi:hypothetical protein